MSRRSKVRGGFLETEIGYGKECDCRMLACLELVLAK